MVVADRPEDLEAALRFMAAEGMDLIVTSGGLGPTADDLTAEVVARFAGRELVLDEEMEEKIAAILRGFARRFSFDEEAVREANRKQAMIPEGALPLDPVGTAPGLVVPAGERVVIVLPGPAARAAADVAAGARVAAGAGGAVPRHAAARLHGADVRHTRVGDRQEPARDRGRRGRAGGGRDHHLPAPGRDRDRRPLPGRGDPGRRGGAQPGSSIAIPATSSASTARRSTRSWRGCCGGAGWPWPSPAPAACWRRGSPTCRAHRPTSPAASSPTRTRRRRSCSASTRR